MTTHQPVEVGQVERGVDQAGPRALKLMAHAPGTPDLDVDVLSVVVDGAPDRLAEQPAAVAGRRRVLHDVHRQRDDPHRPRCWLAEHQGQRHREPVVHVQLVHDGDVELVHDQGLGDVPGQLGMPLHDRDRAGSESLVGRREAVRAAQREGRDHLHGERGRVVVVDQEDHVRALLADPLAGPFVAVEQRLPVVLPGVAAVDGRADCGHVAGGDAGRDAGHRQRPSLIERCPSGDRPPASIIAWYSATLTPLMTLAASGKLVPSAAKILARK